MKIPAVLFAFSLFSAAQSGFAAEEGNEFIQLKSEATTIARSHNWVRSKTDLKHDVGAPRHYVTSYQLAIEELFGFHFQCVSSSVWSKELNDEGNPAERKVYLTNGCMTFADPEEGYSPYAYASWTGLLLVNEPSSAKFDVVFNYYYSLTYGTEVLNQFSMKCIHMGSGETVGGEMDIPGRRNGEGEPYTYGVDFMQPGVYKIELTLRSFFSTPAYYHAFNNLQGGAYVEIQSSNAYFCIDIGRGHPDCPWWF